MVGEDYGKRPVIQRRDQDIVLMGEGVEGIGIQTRFLRGMTSLPIIKV